MREGTLLDDEEFVERELKNEPGINLSELNLTRLPNNFATSLSNTLRVLDLGYNSFGDEFPLGICSLLQLEWFSMGWCGLVRVPYEMKQLTKLRYLDLKGNKLRSSSFDDRNNNDDYYDNNDKNNTTTTTNNNNNHISPTGTFLPHSLELLYLSYNSFEDGFPTSIFSLPQLTALSVDGCGITTIPSQLSTLTSLHELSLSSNKLTEIPPELFPPLQYSLHTLDLFNNNLLSLPSTIGTLSKLSGLRINYNQLKVLPLEFVQLRNNQWEYLQCGGNPFIPSLRAVIIEMSAWGDKQPRLFEYLARCERGTENWDQIKLILLGNGSAGKESINNI